MSDFFGELKRRNVTRVAIVYIIAAWLLLQVADVLLDNFGVPEWGFRFITVLLILGLPISLIFAWAFEITPDGVKRTKDVDPEHSITVETRRKLDYVIIAALVSALGISLYFNLSDEEPGADAPFDRLQLLVCRHHRGHSRVVAMIKNLVQFFLSPLGIGLRTQIIQDQ